MIQNIDYKVPNGKLLRLEVDITNNTINSIKITGDFFAHPENAITQIEKLITKQNIDDVNKIVKTYIEQNNIQIIGFNSADLSTALKKTK